MDDAQLLRYSRHILLAEMGIDGQRRLLQGQALLIGAGGLGSAAAMYLAASGVGRLTVVDPDRVDLTNLQRQIAHRSDRLGQSKAESIAETLRALNPTIEIDAQVARADADSIGCWLPAADVVVDCSDNFATRQAINAACVLHRKPLVSGSAIAFDGQLTVYDRRDPDSPCYACIFPPDAAFDEVACATMGVFAPLVGIIGSLQAAEALRLLAGIGRPLTGRLQMLDARSMHWTEVALRRREGCPVCGPQAPGCEPVRLR